MDETGGMKRTPVALAWVATVLVLLATAVTLFFGRDYLYGGSIAGIVVSVIIPFIAAILIVLSCGPAGCPSTIGATSDLYTVTVPYISLGIRHRIGSSTG